ncbi:MAG: hypothetical protein WAO52_10775 [Prolixibacteraceae bacterium]
MKNLSGTKLTKWSLLSVFLFAILISGCAEVTPINDCVHSEPSGFLSGLWHGFIAPLSFVGSLFFDHIAMYAVNNNGGWYDFGFVLGAGILFGGSGKASK